MMRSALACTTLFFLSVTCAMSQPATPAARAELAPSGKLRVGINHSNFLLVNPGSPHGAPKGVAADLAAELAKRLGVPVEYVSFDRGGKPADAIRDAAVDAGFIANEPERANVIEFSSAYLELPATYLVPAGSPPRPPPAADRPAAALARRGRPAGRAHRRERAQRLRPLPHAHPEERAAGARRGDSRLGEAVQRAKARRARGPQAGPPRRGAEAARLESARRAFHRGPAVDRRAEEKRRRGEIPARVRRGDEALRPRRAARGKTRRQGRGRRPAGRLALRPRPRSRRRPRPASAS